MELERGSLVTPTVRLVELLGAGGMGSVWIADHLALETRVAVKFVSSDLVKKDTSILERFNREASLSAKIKSPYVVQIFDHGVMDDGRPYIVMELLEGSSLEEELSRRRLSIPEVTLVVSQTAKALSKAHRLGIVHRDIKPDNLFLTHEDEELFLKVLDFGIAKQTGVPAASAVTSTGAMVGTPEYMSPEQVLSAKSVDFRADLWGLAVVAYHCLTGGVPFTGETLGSLCVAIANGGFEPPSRLRAGLPATVDAWFERALAKDPLERFASARELATSFAAALAGQTIDIAETSGDWSGAHASVSISSVTARPPLASDAAALALAQSTASTSTPDAVRLGSGRVPTFAGTTLDSAAPKRRQIAALGVFVSLVALAGAGVVWLRDGDEAIASPSSESPPREPPPRGSATESAPLPAAVTAMASAPAVEDVAPEGAPEPESSATAAAASGRPVPAPKPQILTPPPKPPKPPSSPVPRPKPPGDKYGF